MTLREDALHTLQQSEVWDMVVIGGGATGLGVAVEAASRGLRTALIERADFAKGTSSRSTKLVHGGVRYLEQMNITLVLDALRERGYMLRNAPHLCHPFSFVVPMYSLLALPYYAAGLKLYEKLSGSLSLGPSQVLSRASTMAALPGVQSDGLRGGVLYKDGQFDDARYIVALLRTLQDLGGVALNYVEATGLLQSQGQTAGVRARDTETGEAFELRAKAVINATGVFSEELLKMDGSAGGPLLSVSQGSHVVLPRTFLPGDNALMIPKTSDGRVLFAIPWHDVIVVGTTDEPVATSSMEPRAMDAELRFLMEYVTRYLGRRPAVSEVKSVWSGLRPLVRAGGGATSKLSRDHHVFVSPTGLITITGGKWTTYRKMGEDTVNRACELHGLKAQASATKDLKLHGWLAPDAVCSGDWSAVYGADLPALQAMVEAQPELGRKLHPHLPFVAAEVIWAARYEMARCTEDVLARRTRALFMEARAAIECAPMVSALLAKELGRDEAWSERDLERFNEVALGYLYVESSAS